MTELSYRGRFVWHDMVSTDSKASKDFYTGLFGWRTVRHDNLGPYEMLHVGDMPIGGIVQLDPEQTPGVPSHWIGYVDVDDAAACARRNEANGGTTVVPIMDLPGVGKFGVFRDPGGAVISPFQDTGTSGRPPLPEVAPVGAFIWDELHALDPAASMAFYGEVFGWTFRERPMGEEGMYHVGQGADGIDSFGLMRTPAAAKVPYQAWLSYIHVDDVVACHARATELGAETHVPPGVIPDVGRFAVMGDPTGAVFAVFTPTAPL